MALSFAARELVKGLWCEADDQGVFEWKPLTLKARIMPADAVDLKELLGELEAGGLIRAFQADDRAFGVIRNFRRFQRPKSPTAVHPLPNEFRTYVGLPAIISEELPQSLPSDPPKPPQMEDGGKDGGENSDADASGGEPPSAKDIVWGPTLDELAKLTNTTANNPKLRKLLGRWCQLYPAERVTEAVEAACRMETPPPDPVAYVTAVLMDRKAQAPPREMSLGAKISQANIELAKRYAEQGSDSHDGHHADDDVVPSAVNGGNAGGSRDLPRKLLGSHSGYGPERGRA